jgi:hypothetical protein
MQMLITFVAATLLVATGASGLKTFSFSDFSDGDEGAVHTLAAPGDVFVMRTQVRESGTVLCIHLDHDGTGWIGIGISPYHGRYAHWKMHTYAAVVKRGKVTLKAGYSDTDDEPVYYDTVKSSDAAVNGVASNGDSTLTLIDGGVVGGRSFVTFERPMSINDAASFDVGDETFFVSLADHNSKTDFGKKHKFARQGDFNFVTGDGSLNLSNYNAGIFVVGCVAAALVLWLLLRSIHKLCLRCDVRKRRARAATAFKRARRRHQQLHVRDRSSSPLAGARHAPLLSSETSTVADAVAAVATPEQRPVVWPLRQLQRFASARVGNARKL